MGSNIGARANSYPIFTGWRVTKAEQAHVYEDIIMASQVSDLLSGKERMEMTDLTLFKPLCHN